MHRTHYLPANLIALAIATFLALAASAATEPFGCFTMHGSVAPDIGHPTWRISPETRDGLIVLQDKKAAGTYIDPLPANVGSLFPNDQRAMDTIVTGDFVVCPLEGPRPGRGRLARLKSASNLHVQIQD